MLKTAIVGAAGYAGGELLRILSSHPEIEITLLCEQEVYQGQKVSDVYPNLEGKIELKFEKLGIEKLTEISELIFLALPNGKAMSLVPEILKKGKKVIDFSADFRFEEANVYEEWYQLKHQSPEFLKSAVYGLPELYREKIKNANIIANPGCYPTSAILGLAPLMKKDIIEINNLIIDAKSGITGAGRSLSLSSHFAEANENLKAYSIATHRHTPEIEQELSKLTESEIKISFTPHLVPMNRGILSTIYCSLKKEIKTRDVIEIYQEFYQNEPFLRILEEGQFPATKYVQGSNYCFLGFKLDERTKRLIIISVIDNLVKGASGQAVQNMNIMFGFAENLSLKEAGIFP